MEQNVKFLETSYDGDAYLGIPYAKPPVGKLRFQKPKPYGAFDGTLEAIAFGSSCPQANLDFIDIDAYSANEDCLFLDVYVPRSQPDKSAGHAVMIWIHGGGFMHGAGSFTKGNVLAAHGNVIVVTVNYRLGMFGFLDIDDERASGNMGLFDQQLAIKWVNNNIASFGGDVGRITIFGESAGAVSVHYHTLFPENRGLFQNAILQSGTVTLPFVVGNNNTHTAKILAEKLDCPSDSTDDIFSCLQSVDTVEFIALCEELIRDPQTGALVSFSPSIDGSFIKRDPRIVINEFDSEEVNFMQEINIINGVNGFEGAIFTVAFKDEFDNVQITHENMTTMYIPAMFGAVFLGQTVPDAVKSLIEFEFTDWQNPKDARMCYMKYNGDIFFNVPAFEFQLVQANNTAAKTWFYNFMPVIEKQLLPTPSWANGANHGDDVPVVFGYDIVFPGQNETTYVPPQWEQELSGRVMSFWSNMAKFG